MPRITIEVPEEMYEAIASIGCRVNWSALAQESFRLAIKVHKVPKELGLQDGADGSLVIGNFTRTKSAPAAHPPF